MKFYFIYNGKHSKYDLGLEIEYIPPMPSFINDDNMLPISFAYKLNCDKQYKYEVLRSLFRSGGELILSTSLDRFFNVTSVEFKEIECNKSYIVNSVIFTLEPYIYLKEGKENITITSSPCSLTNDRASISEPVLKIFGSGNCTLNINNENISFYIRDEYIIIDSVLKDCYTSTGLVNNDVDLSYFPLLLSENNISYVGNITRIEIIPNWRC